MTTKVDNAVGMGASLLIFGFIGLLLGGPIGMLIGILVGGFIGLAAK